MHSDLKIQRLRLRIDELEQEVSLLRSALVSSQKATEENKLYAAFYERINQLVTSGKYKGADLDRILQEQIVPITTEFSFNLASLTRTINKDIQQTTRSVVTSVAREFDRLLKEQQFNEDKLNETVSGLLTNFKALKGVDYLKKQFELAQRTELSEENYRSMLSLFKHEIDCLKNDVPNLKGMERLDTLLRKLESEGIELFNCNGWVNLVQPEIKVLEVNTEDKKLRELIGVIAAEFKRAYNKFPELKSHVSGTIIEILESELLLELIDGGSIERLKEIIVHQVETVRVDNVYQYEGTK
jgi:cell division septum initiation protein DivIVA